MHRIWLATALAFAGAATTTAAAAGATPTMPKEAEPTMPKCRFALGGGSSTVYELG